jgi:hypothetical protein
LQELGGKIVAESGVRRYATPRFGRFGRRPKAVKQTGTGPMVAMLHLAPSDRCPKKLQAGRLL